MNKLNYTSKPITHPKIQTFAEIIDPPKLLLEKLVQSINSQVNRIDNKTKIRCITKEIKSSEWFVRNYRYATYQRRLSYLRTCLSKYARFGLGNYQQTCFFNRLVAKMLEDPKENMKIIALDNIDDNVKPKIVVNEDMHSFEYEAPFILIATEVIKPLTNPELYDTVVDVIAKFIVLLHFASTDDIYDVSLAQILKRLKNKKFNIYVLISLPYEKSARLYQIADLVIETFDDFLNVSGIQGIATRNGLKAQNTDFWTTKKRNIQNLG